MTKELLVLGSDVHVVPPHDGGMVVCVISETCIVQRLIAGHWMDRSTCLPGTVVISSGSAPLRVVGRSNPESLALLLTAGRVATLFPHLANAMRENAVLTLPTDAIAASLAKALTISEPESVRAQFHESLVEVLLARLSQTSQQGLCGNHLRSGRLPAWRYRRVVNLVNERMGENVSLADMAAATGLSPMHFAAQFKATVGVTPHQYVLLQRIEEAKIQLGRSGATILDIALSVGFQTQAHFATVFKRIEQTTPSQWRKNRMAA